jgi:hypothetical protein
MGLGDGWRVELQPTSTLSRVSFPAQPIYDDLRFGLHLFASLWLKREYLELETVRHHS